MMQYFSEFCCWFNVIHCRQMMKWNAVFVSHILKCFTELRNVLDERERHEA